MKILYYDCFSGISGDMNLAAMIDLGLDPDYLRRELSGLGMDDEFELKVTKDSRKGIYGTKVDVVLKTHSGHHGHMDEDENGSHHQHAAHGEHGVHSTHENGHHEHHLKKEHGHHGAHRNLRDIEAIINGSSLNDDIKKTAIAIFTKLASAEARVHGADLYEVHFHEVGAVDAIVDITGAAICYHYFNVDAVWSSPVELGGGFVRCAHGLIPVPAPATVEILTGIPTKRGAVMKETTTPTGAAILASITDKFISAPSFTVEKTAYGIGRRDTEIPNVLRVHLAES